MNPASALLIRAAFGFFALGFAALGIGLFLEYKDGRIPFTVLTVLGVALCVFGAFGRLNESCHA
jgi:hypothetical protein